MPWGRDRFRHFAREIRHGRRGDGGANRQQIGIVQQGLSGGGGGGREGRGRDGGNRARPGGGAQTGGLGRRMGAGRGRGERRGGRRRGGGAAAGVHEGFQIRDFQRRHRNGAVVHRLRGAGLKPGQAGQGTDNAGPARQMGRQAAKARGVEMDLPGFNGKGKARGAGRAFVPGIGRHPAGQKCRDARPGGGGKRRVLAPLGPDGGLGRPVRFLLGGLEHEGPFPARPL